MHLLCPVLSSYFMYYITISYFFDMEFLILCDFFLVS